MDFVTERFAGERMANVALLYGLKAEQLDRAGTLEGVGDITVEGLLRLMQQHDRGHLAEIENLARAS